MELTFKPDTEKLFLLIVFFLLLWLGLGPLWDHRIKHDFPYGYMASDTFQHQTRAESIKDAGNYRNEAFYIVKGFKDVVGYYPPLLYHIGVIFSNLSGLEVYDGAYFVIFFLVIAAVLLLYFVLRHFQPIVAILAMPLTMLLFTFPIYIAFTWGHWPALVAGLFVVAVIWAVQRFELPYFYTLLALFFAGILLSHTSEAVFAFTFLLAYLGIRALFGKVSKADFKQYILAGIIAGIISLYFLILFQGTWSKVQPFRFHQFPVWEGTPGFYFSSFGWVLSIIIVAGMIIGLLVLAKKNFNAAIIAGFIFFILGFANYVGFSFRAFQLRFFWPLYLAVFFGLVFYKIGHEAGKLLNKKWDTISAVIVSLLLLAVLVYARYEPVKSPGLMDPYHWKAFGWIEQNTPQDAKIYFFYGDIYGQDALMRNIKREHYLINYQDYIESIRNQTIRRNYKMKIPGDSGAGIPYRKSLFSYGFHAWETPQDYFYGYRDICSFDYYVFDHAGSQQSQPIFQVNNFIRTKFLEHSWMHEVFRNEVLSIVKNDKPGEDCLAA
ncbi:hypothetical protein HYV81_03415 [Candidatus Woesearchaeota archaeon]|nr:hypothetical protein [Candidatus Woesearchaeota archaeon]